MYRSRMLCDSCERILSVYSRLGYKITKLLPRLDKVLCMCDFFRSVGITQFSIMSTA